MKKLLILQGVPGAGKSTWAREFIKGKDDWVIVNRDSLRNMSGDYFVEKREKYISDLEESAIDHALSRGYNVIVDATNLNPKTINKWKKFEDVFDVEVEFKEFKISFEESVERDSKRENPVGKKVIKRFFRMYYPEQLKEESKQTIEHKRTPINNNLPKAVICDIDGTIAWMQDRSPYDYTKVSNDKYDERLVELLHALQKQDIVVIFVSGREGTEQCINDTMQWIRKYFKEYWFICRKANDYRPDEVIKEEIYHNEIENRYDIICVFDDRNKVVNMWRNLGLLCCQVNNGDF